MDAGRGQHQARWMPARLSPSWFRRVGLLRLSVARNPHTGTADWAHWSRPTFEASTIGVGGDSFLRMQLCAPQSAGEWIHTRTTHTQTPSHTHARRNTHQRWDARARTHASPFLLRRATLGWGGVGWSDLRVLVHQQAPLRLLAPMKLLFFVAVNLFGSCVYLFSKLSPVTKSNLQHWNNQWRLAIRGALRFLELK